MCSLSYSFLSRLHCEFCEKKFNSFQWRSQYLVVVKALDGWVMGRGVPSPWRRGMGKGMCPLPRKFSFFCVKVTCFAAYFGTILSN